MRRLFAVLIGLSGGVASCTSTTTDANGVDPQIARDIASIKAIDNHAHPVRPTAPGEAPDMDFDALPVDHLEPQSDPIQQRGTSPMVSAATRELFGADKDATTKAHANDYATYVLDKMGVETMVANRVSMGPGLPSPRFQWVPFVDALMFPLDNTALMKTPDQKAFFPLEEKLLARYYKESGLAGRPRTLDEYLTKVVRGTLERHKQGGAIGEKFELAYLRTVGAGNPTRAEAEQAWSGHGDYTALQDYLYRFILSECGRLGLVVQIHLAHGGGGYFNTSWANPMNLESLLNDPSLRSTKFMMVHGGWPYTREITPLLTKPNAYLDFSEQTTFDTQHNVAEALRGWLGYVPEKVLFATDAYPFSKELGWEEAGVVGANNARIALGRALTAMLHDGEITRERAGELARMVMRDNAKALYGLK